MTAATVPESAWLEAWTALASWKGFVQPFPGFQRVTMGTRTLEDGDVHLHVSIDFDEPEQLEKWLTSGWTVPELLGRLAEPAYAVHDEVLEGLS
jgi:antibiotic biosynthesis monooxygenase (ABM) superfamily enzyme